MEQKEKNASLREIGAYPWRAAKLELLDQVGEPSTLVNQSQSAGMDGGGVVLRVVVQMVQEN